MFSPPSSFSSWLNLLQNSRNVGEKSGNTTRPVSQQVGEETSDHEDVDDDDDNGTKAEQWCEEEKQEDVIVHWWTGEEKRSCVLSEL